MKKFLGWVLVVVGGVLTITTIFQGGVTVKKDAPVNDNLKLVANRVTAIGGVILMAIGGSMLLKNVKAVQ